MHRFHRLYVILLQVVSTMAQLCQIRLKNKSFANQCFSARDLCEHSFTVCGISNNMGSFLSSQKVIFHYYLTVGCGGRNTASMNRCFS